ncbi:hypothetical protein AGMMS49944_26480 [Spirochaetia bacterium]|nr:hypothetical protein AGMMS49944_26480 [Spirochaetia bacterium]
MKRYSEEEKRMWVEDWKESGTGRYQYCRSGTIAAAAYQPGIPAQLSHRVSPRLY